MQPKQIFLLFTILINAAIAAPSNLHSRAPPLPQIHPTAPHAPPPAHNVKVPFRVKVANMMGLRRNWAQRAESRRVSIGQTGTKQRNIQNELGISDTELLALVTKHPISANIEITGSLRQSFQQKFMPAWRRKQIDKNLFDKYDKTDGKGFSQTEMNEWLMWQTKKDVAMRHAFADRPNSTPEEMEKVFGYMTLHYFSADAQRAYTDRLRMRIIGSGN